MKRYARLLLVPFLFVSMLVLAALAPVQPAQAAQFPTFAPPVDYPANLDDLYQKIESQEYGWTFTDCKSMQSPFFSWQQVKLVQRMSFDDNGTSQIIIPAADMAMIASIGGVKFPNTGTLRISEDRLFAIVIKHGLSGHVLACGIDGFPVLHGAGVQTMFSEIGAYVK